MWDGQAKHSCLCRTIQTETVCESSPGSPKEPRAARAAWCRIPKPPTPLAQCSPAGTGLRAPPAPRVPGGEGLKMQEHLQQPYSSKAIPFPSGCTNLSIWAGAGAKYPAGRQDPVSVRLVRDVRSKASCVIWFFSAWRQQDGLGFPDLSGHSHLLTLADGS